MNCPEEDCERGVKVRTSSLLWNLADLAPHNMQTASLHFTVCTCTDRADAGRRCHKAGRNQETACPA